MKLKNTLGLLLLACCILLGNSNSNAQISIGAGTDESQSVPIEAYYGYTYSQSIYLQPSINSSGTITSLAWYFSGTSTLTNTQDIVVWMGHTAKTSFASTTDWVDTTGLTRVYTGSLGTPAGPGWITITLDNSFAYNNTDNLIIAVDENTASYDASGDDFYCSSTGNTQSIWYRNDGTNPDPGAPPTATGTTANVPNITLGGLVAALPPNCDAALSSPSNGASNVIETTDLTWSPASGSPSGYKIQIGTSTGGSQFLAQTDIGAVTTYTPASSFAFNTTYFVTITAYNANGDATGCTEESFTTRADPTVVAPWFDGFESHGTTTNATFNTNDWVANPTGTTSLFRWNIDGSGSTPSSNTGPTNGAYAGSNYLYVEASSGSTNAVAELTTPPIDISGLTVPRLKFYHHMYGSATGSLDVDVYDGTWHTAALTITGQQQSSGTDPWNESTLDLSSYSSPVTIRFSATRGSSYEGDISLDNVEIEESPSCVNPTALSTSKLTSDTATVTWVAGGSETSWEVSYGSSGFTAGAGSQVIVGTNSYTLAGLTAATSYHAYVRAICSPGDTSNWAGPLSFTTLIQGPAGFSCLTGSATTVFTETFDAIGLWTGDVSAATVSGDWNFGFSGTTGSSNTGPSGAYDGSSYVYFESSSGSTGSMVSPAINLVDANDYAELSFWMHAYGATMGDLDVGVGTSPSGPFTNVFSWSGQYQSSSADPWVNVGVNLDAYVGQTIYVEFFFTKGSSYDGDMSIDLMEVSTCISCPTPSNLMTSNSTGSSTDLSWTENGSASQWEYSLGGSGFTAGTGTQGITGSNPVTLSGLTPLSNYDVYVRAICGPGDTSGWSNVHPFFFAGNPLSGTYTVNSGAATAGTNFTNFADLNAALDAAGISGPVTVNVVSNSGPYNEQVIFTTTAGASATNTITINGNGETITYAAATGDRRIVGFDGAKHITLDSLTIVSIGTTYGFGIHFMNASDSNTVQNCTIDLSSITSTSSANSAGILSSAAINNVTTDGNNANALIIDNNTIGGGASGSPYSAIYLNGNGVSGRGLDSRITNNTIQDFYGYGIFVDDQENLLVKGNDISRPNRTTTTTGYGFYASSGTSLNMSIESNAFHAFNAGDPSPTSANYPIYFSSCDATLGNENTVVNNLIYDLNGTGTIYALYNTGSDYVNYYHNTVSLDDQNATGGTTRAFYQTTTATGISIMNNVFSITRTGTGTKHALYFNAAASTISSDYNSIYMNAPAGTNSYGYFGGNMTTFLDWQGANTNAYDQNSIEASPVFLGTTDLTPAASDLDSAGTTGLGVLVDYFGASRTTPPDLGAIEFTPPACAPVSGITADSLSSNFVRVSWTAGGGQESWNLEYGPAGFTQGTGTLVSAILTQPYDITGLMSTTDYDIYVQSKCEGKGNTSPWSGPLTITTSIAGPQGFSCITGNAAAVITEEFDAQGAWTGDFGSGSTARTWNITSGTTTSGSTGPSGAHSGSNYMYYEASSGTPTEAEAISPAINLNDANDYAELSFWLHAYGATMGTLDVGVSTSASGPWTSVFTWANQIQTASADPWTNVGVNLDAYVGQTIYLRFHMTHGADFYGDMSIDLLEVTTCLSCVNPSAPVTSNVLTNSADLSWTQGLSETQWEVSYGASGFTAGAGTEVLRNVSNYALTGLTADTDYDWYVRSVCGPGDTSGWTGPNSFFTGYCSPNPSSVDGSGITNVTFSTVNNTTGTEVGNYGDYSAMIGDVGQGLSIPVDITFATGYTYGTKIWIDWNNDLDFSDAGELVYTGLSTSANPTTLNASFTVDGSQALGNYRMRIGGADNDAGPSDECYTGSYGSFEDYTINVVLPPACPIPTSLNVSAITINSATVGWTENGTATSWEISYGGSGFTVGAGTQIVVNSNPYQIMGLTPFVDYDWYVRAICGPGDTSAWSGVSSGRIDYCTPAPSSVDGSGITNVSFSSVNNTTGTEVGNFGDYSAMVGDVIQGYSIPVDITYSTGYTYGTKIWVDWNNDLDFSDAGELVYTGLSTSANPTTLNASFMVPGAQTLGNYRMRIGGADNDAGPSDECYTGTYGSFEDYTINVIAEPLCSSPMNLRALFLSDTSARLRWNEIDGATSYKIRWKVAGAPSFGAPVFRNTNTGFWNIPSGLTANTKYIFSVTANCMAGWGEPSVGNFTTLSAPCAIPTNINTRGIIDSQARLQWAAVTGAVKYRIRFRAQGAPAWTSIVVTAPRTLKWVTGLAASTNYEWQIKTVCQVGVAVSGTQWSDLETFTTLPSTSPPPSARLKDVKFNIENLNHLDLYPNPNEGSFNLELASETALDLSVVITNITGQVVYSNQLQSDKNQLKHEIDITGQAPGIYFLRLSNNDGVETKRFIINE